MHRQPHPLVVVSLVELTGPESSAIRHDPELQGGPDQALNYPDYWYEKQLGLFLFDPLAGWQEKKLDLHCPGVAYSLKKGAYGGEFVCSTIGDIDGDGCDEIICGVTLRSGCGYLFSLQYNKDSWFPSPIAQFDDSNINFLRSVYTGDIDGDDVDEIVVATKPSGFVLLYGRGEDGYVQTILDKNSCGQGSTNTREVVIADADNDGVMEVLATHASALSDDNKWGSTPGCIMMYKPFGTKWHKTTIDDFANETHSRMFIVGDVKGTGKNQIVANVTGIYDSEAKKIAPPTHMKLYEISGSGFNSQHIDTLALAVKSRGFALGDVDGDGKNELIVGTRSLDVEGYRKSYLLCYKYNPRTRKWSKEEVDSTGEIGFHAVAAFVIDGDGRDEFVASDDQNGLIKSYKLVNGSWQKQTIREFGHRIFVVSINALRIWGRLH